MQTSPEVALFLPAWNEAENLPFVVAEAIAYLHGRGRSFVVIIVDDGSTDNTVEIVEQLSQAYPGLVQLVQHEQNRGYGAALRTGFRAGLTAGAEWVGFCDADGQFRPHDIGKLIDSATSVGADIAIGYRIERADGLKRRMMGRMWHMLSRSVLGYKAIDVDCGFKLFSRDALLDLEPQLAGDYATISPEILARAYRAGHRVIEVGVNHYPRVAGVQSGASLKVVWQSFRGLIQVRQIL